MAGETSKLHDTFGRTISYLRLSLTDRCDMRCRYCMAEDMVFLPRSEVLSLEELVALANAFVDRGITRIRLTGGEPLVRRGALDVVRAIGQRIGTGLDEVTMTTNGARLVEFAQPLRDAGVRRINVSLDSRDPDVFRHITRFGDLAQVLDGISAAKDAGLAIKINMVALKGLNDGEFATMARWCGEQGFDLTLIETMPVGQIDDREDRFLPLDVARDAIAADFALLPSTHRTGGPARYWQLADFGTQLGLISPLTRNFCDSCNRIRVTASGQLYMCLGHDDHVDLRAALRSGSEAALDEAVAIAMRQKPKRHDFDIAAAATERHMNRTGG
jgi:GTP 3',8-cyclase